MHLQFNTYTHFFRIREEVVLGAPPPPPPIIFEGRNLLQQTIYHWKGNLSVSPSHFRYRQNILISRPYEQFSRNDSAMPPEKNFKLKKYEHTHFYKIREEGGSASLSRRAFEARIVFIFNLYSNSFVKTRLETRGI